MPIDFYSSLKKTSRWAVGSKILNSIFSSCLYTAILITLIVMLIIMFIYPSKSGTSFGTLFKLFIYIFMGSLAVLFIHDGVVKYIISEEYENKKDADVMRLTNAQGRENLFEQDNIPVRPNNIMGGDGGDFAHENAAHDEAAESRDTTSDDLKKLETVIATKSVPSSPVAGGDSILGGAVLGGRKPPPPRGNLFR